MSAKRPPDPDHLTLHVSPDVPHIDTRNLGTGVTVVVIDAVDSKIRSFTHLEAHLVSADFIVANLHGFTHRRSLPGSLLVLDPDGKWNKDHPGFAPLAETVYEVRKSLPGRAALRVLLRNLARRLWTERELVRKARALEEMATVNRELLEIGIALSAERDMEKLFDRILRKSREITHADSGSIYLVEDDPQTPDGKLLRFKYTQNDSNPSDYTEFTMPATRKSVAGYVGLTGSVLNIPDVYEIPDEAEYSFSDIIDKATGYRCMSMLTVPMRNHHEQIIGILQLINKKLDRSVRIHSPEETVQVCLPFSQENEDIVLALASLAGVSLENNMLYEEIQRLFEGFVRASVQAIEQRDPTTSGHSNRVTAYTVALAEATDRTTTGPYADLHFSEEQMRELRYACLLHDFGKVGVREAVLVKANKLYPDQLTTVLMRFNFIRELARRRVGQKRLEYVDQHGEEKYASQIARFDAEEAALIEELTEAERVVVESNKPALLSEEPQAILARLLEHVFTDDHGQDWTLIDDAEFHNLSIPKGSLNPDERKEIESHVLHSIRFLEQIPWTADLNRIPAIAIGHHEFLNGDGYPNAWTATQIPPETRMMTVADIFDALTASDRPYKSAASTERALAILQEEVKDNHIDPDLLAIFIDAKIYELRDEFDRIREQEKQAAAEAAQTETQAEAEAKTGTGAEIAEDGAGGGNGAGGKRPKSGGPTPRATGGKTATPMRDKSNRATGAPVSRKKPTNSRPQKASARKPT